MLFLIVAFVPAAVWGFSVLAAGGTVLVVDVGLRLYDWVQRRRRLALVTLLLVALSSPAFAQAPADVYTTTRKEPRSMFLAMTGVAIATGGFVVIGQRDPCCCYAQPTPHQIGGGVALVGVGVGLMVYGTRLQWVTRVVPSVSRHGYGVTWSVR